ncbi:hypothetical protein BZL30_7400 [Mycobacterium kansasii]|uniref:Uncharacterized protein n=1 Tax=Mycobacterium kansasii TaxID=1768 RepID=A0A1V3WQD5_MYCKA|nr:hypothetical protein BZL30_7400 [Mycobacterium kansasii]
MAPGKLTGRAGSVAWDLAWTDAGAPLWTFPRAAWERELLPGAQVVLAPTADFTGSLSVDSEGTSTHPVTGWRGGVAHIYGHGNAKRWAGSTPTSAAATSWRPSPRCRTSRDCASLRHWRSSGSALTEKTGRQALSRPCGCAPRSAWRTGSWRDASAAGKC